MIPLTEEKTGLVTVFGLFEPDNHYAHPELYVSEDFKFPHPEEYLLEKYKEADCSGPSMVGGMSEDEIINMFRDWGNYELYGGSFIFVGTEKAIREVEDLSIEPDYDYEGSAQFPVENLKEYIEEIEGLENVIFINPEDGIFQALKGTADYEGNISKLIAGYVLQSNNSASIISKIRRANPDNPILGEIASMSNPDVLKTLGDLGDLGF